MPKESASLSSKLSKLVKEFGDRVFQTDGKVLFCKACEKSVNCDKKYFVSQHCESGKHQAAVAKKAAGATSTARLLSTCIYGKQSEFSMDLCGALMCADIPLHKVENPAFKDFLQKYTKEQVPSETTLRKVYVGLKYQETLGRIRSTVGEHHIWVSIDETTDTKGRYVANTIVGTLDRSKESEIFLLNSECLEKTNASTIAQALTNALNLLWPQGVKYDRVLLLVTDAAAYMKKAASGLKTLFPNMIFLTCLAHALHRVAEEVRTIFPDVDKLISNGKKVFLKAPSRVASFKEQYPDLPLPPAPVLTRWGTWLDAAIYYSTNFDAFRSVVDAFDGEDAAAIEATQALLQKNQVRNDLAFIASHLHNLSTTITKLEERNLPLTSALEIFQAEVERIESIPGQKGLRICSKLNSVVQRNNELETLKKIARVLAGETDVDVRRSPAILANYKYAPVTSVDVERSFYKLKNILSDNRQSFAFDSLRKFVVVNCNPRTA
jgi:hypothetical protein